MRLGVADTAVIIYLCDGIDQFSGKIAVLNIALWRIMRHRTAIALLGGLTLAAQQTAWAQESEGCADPAAHCIAQCLEENGSDACGPEAQAVAACRSAMLQQCAPQPQLQAAPQAAAPSIAAPKVGGQRAIRILSFPKPQDVKLHFLLRDKPEPTDAALYGYVIVGADAPADRKAAVAQGLACRLDAAAADGPAAGIGLMVTPSTAQISATPVSPEEWLSAYDFPRADRWARQIADALGVTDSMSRRILFIAAPKPLAADLDGAEPLIDPAGAANAPMPFLVADASELSPRYLRRWTHNLVEGVRAGMLSSEQEMQEWMEFHSWIESVGRPFAELIELRASAAEASTGFECY